MKKLVLKTAPLEVIDGIPVFTHADRYTENYDRIARDHLKAAKDGDTNPFFHELDWRLAEESTERLMRQVARPGQSILDVGVGTGRLLERFPELLRHGVDISIDYLRLAKQKGIEPYLARAEDLPFNDDEFDLLVSTDMIEHVLDLHSAISDIWRVLKPGGHLIVRVPYDENLALYLSPDLPYDFIHVRAFDEHGLKLQLCRIFDFEYIAESYAYAITGARQRIPMGLAGKGTYFILRHLLFLVPRIYPWAARLLCRPLVISMLVRKPR